MHRLLSALRGMQQTDEMMEDCRISFAVIHPCSDYHRAE